ncbi:hypothetical protein BKA70DRAFT_1269854 [Coprinopsis sp. MPI-PUGE-AT-0042]|nr:hypothetical protein BKA70DRAFT_1269854 [Coprinopsis sp. MPI-PUGE-AT-0042]
MAGAGKSILASLAINAVEAHAAASTTPVFVSFLYVRYSDHTKFTVRDLLEVLVKQTVERHPASLSRCNELYNRHIREKTEPSVKELVGLLKRFMSELMMTTLCFLDALDEAPSDVHSRSPQKLGLSRRQAVPHLTANETTRGAPFPDCRPGRRSRCPDCRRDVAKHGASGNHRNFESWAGREDHVGHQGQI